jgi:hypothetical protein
VALPRNRRGYFHSLWRNRHYEHAGESAAFPDSVVALRSRYDIQATVSRLNASLATRGVTRLTDIDQSEAAALAGTVLRPTRLCLFGDPKTGTPIMKKRSARGTGIQPWRGRTLTNACTSTMWM